MKTILLSILLSVSLMGAKAQFVALNALIRYVSMPVADVTEEIISRKGWELSESKNQDGTATLKFEGNGNNNSTIIIEQVDDNENEVFFICDKINYDLLTKSLLALNPTFVGSKVTKQGNIVKTYDGKTYGYAVTIAPKSSFSFQIYKRKGSLLTKDENDDRLSIHKGDGGSGFGETPIALRKFTNLVLPEDDGQQMGKIAVRLKINKNGTVIDATPGVKGTTLTDRELWQKCKDAVMGARLEQSESAPNVQIGIVVFNFKIK
ncbi:hypothetical protein ABIE26_000824 [Pedobacter africanus]|uniref:Uncharacterized protein n=1 Tax=Pedobacter africanus TaxID=151894 RepID=A0ACC6KTW7_9SPHI|nr:hypothetical protein [Pedobacter africanus]MDR6782689.1 hypothetical protein [Pedobacter africanus]